MSGFNRKGRKPKAEVREVEVCIQSTPEPAIHWDQLWTTLLDAAEDQGESSTSNEQIPDIEPKPIDGSKWRSKKQDPAQMRLL